jgi:type 1 fimbria pilin
MSFAMPRYLPAKSESRIMKNFLRILAIVGSVLMVSAIPSLAHAACTQAPNGMVSATVTMPTQATIPRDATIGTVIARGSVKWTVNNQGASCPGNSTQSRVIANMRGGASDANNIWPTSNPNIGLKIIMDGSTVVGTANGTTTLGTCGGGSCYSYYGTQAEIQVIKTGPVVDTWTLAAGPVLEASIGGILSTRISITGVDIIGQTCTVTTPSVSVDLGKVPRTSFTAVGSTAGEKGFQIGLDCRGAVANVGITFIDAVDPQNATTTLPLTRESTAGGVGIQILYSGSPVRYGADSSVAGNPGQVMLGTINNATRNLDFSGRYVQTAPTVTPGTANGLATFTMSYQ